MIVSDIIYSALSAYATGECKEFFESLKTKDDTYYKFMRIFQEIAYLFLKYELQEKYLGKTVEQMKKDGLPLINKILKAFEQSDISKVEKKIYTPQDIIFFGYRKNLFTVNDIESYQTMLRTTKVFDYSSHDIHTLYEKLRTQFSEDNIRTACLILYDVYKGAKYSGSLNTKEEINKNKGFLLNIIITKTGGIPIF